MSTTSGTGSNLSSGVLGTASSLSRKTFNIPLLGTISAGTALVIFGIGYLLARKRSPKYGVVKLK